jgi:hypothetical protein
MQIRSAKSESGFALVLAIVALMLLTFLGLTLSLSTATETQVARNYSWSRQAHYNALAGAEVAKSILANAILNNTVVDWGPFLPPVRNSAGMSGLPGGGAGTGSSSPRDFEGFYCDKAAAGAPTSEYGRGNVGYGRILTTDGTVGGPRLEDITTHAGHSLKGAFTIWVRRPTSWNSTDLRMVDDTTQLRRAIITVEGVAPYVFSAAGGAAMRQQQAVQIIEIDLEATANITGRRIENSDGSTGAFRSMSDTGVAIGQCAPGAGSGGTVATDTAGAQ